MSTKILVNWLFFMLFLNFFWDQVNLLGIKGVYIIGIQYYETQGAAMDIITRLEEAILIAIWRLQDKAYGVTINKSVSEFLNKEYTLGALYYSLDQLLRKGLVAKTLKRIPKEKVGRSRTYYRLTKDGAKALQEARVCQNKLWKGIADIAFKAEESK